MWLRKPMLVEWVPLFVLSSDRVRVMFVLLVLRCRVVVCVMVLDSDVGLLRWCVVGSFWRSRLGCRCG